MSKRLEIKAAIIDKMISGDLLPSEGIPEESLAAEFSTSRTPVREALISLEAQCLVSSEANRGFRVTSVSIEQIRSYFEMARALYPTLFRTAMERQSARLGDQIEQLDRGEDDPVAADAATHLRFMMVVAAATQNPYFSQSVEAIESYHAMVRNKVCRSLSPRVVQAADRELVLHRRNLKEAFAANDEAQLVDSAGQMIDGSRVFLLSNLV